MKELEAGREGAQEPPCRRSDMCEDSVPEAEGFQQTPARQAGSPQMIPFFNYPFAPNPTDDSSLQFLTQFPPSMRPLSLHVGIFMQRAPAQRGHYVWDRGGQQMVQHGNIPPPPPPPLQSPRSPRVQNSPIQTGSYSICVINERTLSPLRLQFESLRTASFACILPGGDDLYMIFSLLAQRGLYSTRERVGCFEEGIYRVAGTGMGVPLETGAAQVVGRPFPPGTPMPLKCAHCWTLLLLASTRAHRGLLDEPFVHPTAIKQSPMQATRAFLEYMRGKHANGCEFARQPPIEYFPPILYSIEEGAPALPITGFPHISNCFHFSESIN